jgi:hypothetical protein
VQACGSLFHRVTRCVSAILLRRRCDASCGCRRRPGEWWMQPPRCPPPRFLSLRCLTSQTTIIDYYALSLFSHPTVTANTSCPVLFLCKRALKSPRLHPSTRCSAMPRRHSSSRWTVHTRETLQVHLRQPPLLLPPYLHVHPGDLILRRVLPSTTADDEGGSAAAKASAAVFSDALACLIITAFLPEAIEGVIIFYFNFHVGYHHQRRQHSAPSSLQTAYSVTVIIGLADPPPAPAAQLVIRALLRSRWIPDTISNFPCHSPQHAAGYTTSINDSLTLPVPRCTHLKFSFSSFSHGT